MTIVRRCIHQTFLVIALVSFAACCLARTVVIRVAADDTTTSSETCSFAASDECLVAIRSAKEMLANISWQKTLPLEVSVVRVIFAGQEYRLDQALLIVWSGGTTGQINLQIDGSAKSTVINGSLEISNWRTLQPDEYVGRISPTTLPQIQVAPLSDKQVDAIGHLPPTGFGFPVRSDGYFIFSGGSRLPLAHWPNRGYATIHRSENGPLTIPPTLSMQGSGGIGWQDEPDLQLNAFWFNDWSNQTFKAKQDKTGLLHITNGRPSYGIRDGQRIRVLNALSELDTPGEWYIDRDSRQILLWPRSGEPATEIAAASNLLHIKNSRLVFIQNIKFEKTKGDAIFIEDSKNITLDHIIIENSNRAIVVKDGSNVGVKNSILKNLWEGGISLSGGDRASLDRSNHFVENSIIRDFSQSGYTYRPAINLTGVGQRVVGNEIFNGPHAAIMFSGNEHLIENNDIHNVVLNTSDSGAIYTGRDFTARGTIIRHNFLYDIQPYQPRSEVKGIYLDDQASGIVIEKNIFARVSQPVFIGGGRSNRVLNNVFFRSSPAIHLDARGISWQKAATTDHNRELLTRLRAVPYTEQVWADRYADLARILNDDFGAPKYNIACGNTFIESTPFFINDAAIGGIDLKENHETTNLVFEFSGRASKGKLISDFAMRQPITLCSNN